MEEEEEQVEEDKEVEEDKKVGVGGEQMFTSSMLPCCVYVPQPEAQWQWHPERWRCWYLLPFAKAGPLPLPQDRAQIPSTGRWVGP